MNAAAYDISRFAYDAQEASAADARWRMVWAHGWGQNRQALKLMAQSLAAIGEHIFLDFPGFGASPPPETAWTTADYADLAARFLAARPSSRQTVWIGHSFGCRVGLQLAARHPGAVDRLFLIAAAGLPRNRSTIEQIRFKSRVYGYKALKHLAPLAGVSQDKLRERFGSADYRNAGAMREILVNVVNEDLADVAARIRCPVQLVYGSDDRETPPEIGRRLAALIPGAEFEELAGQDHYTLLADGRHPVAKRLKAFLGD